MHSSFSGAELHSILATNDDGGCGRAKATHQRTLMAVRTTIPAAATATPSRLLLFYRHAASFYESFSKSKLSWNVVQFDKRTAGEGGRIPGSSAMVRKLWCFH